ncbi:MAG: hypothetical protein KGI84_10095, partial [Elusimicrobia bacterium]|nr:hypothetical protein [Elusimicrobiota bacterium]
LLEIAEGVAAEQQKAGAAQVRTALYFAPDFVNAGFHATFKSGVRDEAWVRRHQSRWLGLLSRRAVVPYRLGRMWPRSALGRLNPEYRRALGGVKAMLDPDNLLNRGYPLYV